MELRSNTCHSWPRHPAASFSSSSLLYLQPQERKHDFPSRSNQFSRQAGGSAQTSERLERPTSRAAKEAASNSSAAPGCSASLQKRRKAEKLSTARARLAPSAGADHEVATLASCSSWGDVRASDCSRSFARQSLSNQTPASAVS